LIRHAFCLAATAISFLPVAVIHPSLGTALMAAIGGTMLSAPRPITTLLAAIALPAVATGTNGEQRTTVWIAATS
jgi:hypothetical protein